ncbi:MAG TPA: RNA methyltransferase [Chitinophagales bacterium]|nr:RNA methyltransferase [Chitinophagales bacterium]
MQFPSIRYNSNKQQNRKLSNIPWEKNAYQYEGQMTFITDPLWHGGAYYVQESSSMFLGYMLNQLLDSGLIKKQGCKILDLCAAPGGKSTHVLDLFSNENLLIANELIPKRNTILRENLIRWGKTNYIVTQNYPEDFYMLEQYFDLLLIDAPCSGEGLFRKTPDAKNEWSEENVEICAVRQRNILQNSISLVKDDGILIYSTCTFQEKENEDQINWLLDNGFELIPFDISSFPEITEGKLQNTFRFTFEKVKGSGFFIACLRKVKKINHPIISKVNSIRKIDFPEKFDFQDASNWIKNASEFNFYITKNKVIAFYKTFSVDLNLLFYSGLQITSFGTEIGELKKEIFIPFHALALSDIIRDDMPSIKLDKENALQYLRKNEMNIEVSDFQLGWALVQFEGINLGWVKVLQSRINNYLPNSFRILHY